jgi:sulfate transport system substrate-binding protein
MPSLSILAEPPVTLIDKNAESHGAAKAAEAYLKYLYSPEGQRIVAKHFYRPSDPKQADPADLAAFADIDLLTVDKDFGGWQSAQAKHFSDGGTFDSIYSLGQ